MSSSSSQSSLSATSASGTQTASLSSSSESITFCGPGDRFIELVPYFQKRFSVNYNHGYRIRIEARNPCNMDAEIFRYYRYPPDIETGQIVDEFTGVCSWVDMEELPKDQPRETDCPKACRRNYVDVVVDTETIASDLWEKVKEEVDQLVTTMNRGAILEQGDSHWAGGEPGGS